MKAAGPLQKLLHLANARDALASGDLQQALNEAEAAVDADPTFAAAKTLRAEVLARINKPVPEVQPEAAVVVAAPVSVSTSAVTSAQAAVIPLVDSRRRAISVKSKPQPRRAHPLNRRTSVATALGVLVVGVGVAIALFASGIMFREPRRASGPVPPPRTAESKQPASKPAAITQTIQDVALPAVATSAAPTPTESARTEPPATQSSTIVASAAGVDWASPRLKQLSVRPRWRASAMHVEDAALLKDLGEGISELWVGKLTGDADAIFIGGAMNEDDWVRLRSSLKPTGVIWRIYSSRSPAADASSSTSAAAAGFSRVRKVRYSTEYVGEQFALRAAVR